MLRVCMAALALLVGCGALALGVGQASGGAGAHAGAGVSYASGGAGGREGARAAAGVKRDPALERTWPLSVSPADDDVALVRITFRRSKRLAISGALWAVGVGGPFGDDYLAAAVAPSSKAAGQGLLVLLVNRPSPLLDPAHVRLRLTLPRALGRPAFSALSDPFTRPPPRPPRGLCGLPLQGGALSGSQLREAREHGAPLAGFGPLGAIAQAYDAVCGLPYASAFKTAVEHGGAAGECPPAGGGPAPACCPPSAMCAPLPGAPPSVPPPPVPPPPLPPAPLPEPPKCLPCDPPPGYACPLDPVPSICLGAPPDAARRTATSPADAAH